MIKDAAILAKKKRDADYYTMMIMTGHSIFNTYQSSIKNENNSKLRL
jgi:hypothetical protein